MPHITDELIEAAALDEYWPSIPDEEEAASVEQHVQEEHEDKEEEQQQQRMGEWHEHPKLRRWVEKALAARAGQGTEEARVAGAGVTGVGGTWT